jgi:hypothetical protein
VPIPISIESAAAEAVLLAEIESLIDEAASSCPAWRMFMIKGCWRDMVDQA